MNKLIKAAYAVAGGVMLSTLAVAPAQAADSHGCAWPRVCFYQTTARWNAHNPNSAYQDMGYQTLTAAAKGADHIYNSRNDDGAEIYSRWDDGASRVFCVFPNEHVVMDADETIYAIKIEDSKICAD